MVKLLPHEGDDYQYRIKSSGEAFERVAKESQLDRLSRGNRFRKSPAGRRDFVSAINYDAQDSGHSRASA